MANRFGKVVEGLLVVAALSTSVLAWRRVTAAAPESIPAPTIQVKDWRQELTLDRRVGSKTAPFQLLVWTDYQCPACRQFEKELSRLRMRLGDSLAVVYRNYPIAGHPLAFPAAVAAECAYMQGRFPQMHEALFKAKLDGDSLSVDSIAQQSGAITPAELQKCMMAPQAAAAIHREMAIGDSLHFHGTPYVQIGDKLSLGGMTAERLETELRAVRR